MLIVKLPLLPPSLPPSPPPFLPPSLTLCINTFICTDIQISSQPALLRSTPKRRNEAVLAPQILLFGVLYPTVFLPRISIYSA
jgi:hypothetical protein